nr:MAG TPA_asm: hypothetical protein [Caudoviricetes sp.]
MAAIAFGALGYSIKQNYDIKRQREEDERGRLLFSIIIADKIYILKVENIGNRSVYDLRFSVNNDFVDKIPLPQFKKFLIEATTKKIQISPNSSKLYALSPIEGMGNNDEAIRSLKFEKIEIKGNYNNKYKINESFTMDEFTGSVIISNPIVKELSNINKSIKEIHKSKA